MIEPWLIVVVLAVVGVGAIVLGLSLPDTREQASIPTTPRPSGGSDGGGGHAVFRPSDARVTTIHNVAPRSMSLINAYGAIMERYAGYVAGVCESVLPDSPSAIEAALVSAIVSNPMSDAREILELGLVELAKFLPEPDGSRAMELCEAAGTIEADGTLGIDPSALVRLLADEQDGRDYVLLTGLVVSRVNEKLALINRLSRTHPAKRTDPGRPPDHGHRTSRPALSSGGALSRIPLASSNIASTGYDEAVMTLQVEFRDGAVYEYDGVPRPVYEGLLTASSAGSYFHRTVKGRYPYRRIG